MPSPAAPSSSSSSASGGGTSNAGGSSRRGSDTEKTGGGTVTLVSMDGDGFVVEASAIMVSKLLDDAMADGEQMQLHRIGTERDF